MIRGLWLKYLFAVNPISFFPGVPPASQTQVPLFEQQADLAATETSFAIIQSNTVTLQTIAKNYSNTNNNNDFASDFQYISPNTLLQIFFGQPQVVLNCSANNVNKNNKTTVTNTGIGTSTTITNNIKTKVNNGIRTHIINEVNNTISSVSQSMQKQSFGQDGILIELSNSCTTFSTEYTNNNLTGKTTKIVKTDTYNVNSTVTTSITQITTTDSVSGITVSTNTHTQLANHVPADATLRIPINYINGVFNTTVQINGINYRYEITNTGNATIKGPFSNFY